MSTNHTRSVFEATAGSYDQDRMKLIPGYERFYGAALSLIPPQARKIVDLGAGSGLFSAMLHAAFPEAELHLIDFSPKMLEQAQKRLGSSDRVHYVLADYSVEPLPKEVDAVVSALSIHHLEDEGKQEIYSRAWTALRDGGVFVNADHIAGPTAEMEEVYQQRWLETIRRDGATEKQIEESLYRQQEDRRTPIADQLRWMGKAGFAEVDCWHKDNSFAVMVGRKRQ